MSRPADQPANSVKVWDAPTRIFHWLLVITVCISYFTGSDDMPVLIAHTYFGYIVGLLLVFRLIWGVTGNRYARFRDFVKPWPEIRAYGKKLLRLSPPKYIGHNPLGGLMIIVMLGTLALVFLSGLAAGIDEDVVIPLMGGTPDWLVGLGSAIHEGVANFIVVLVVIHLIGVIVDGILTGDTLIQAMITGRKTLDEETQPALEVASWRAVTLTALLVVAWIWMVIETYFK